jgi:hypothetical protein
MEDYPGLSKWTLNVITNVLMKREAEGDLTTDKEIGDVLSEARVSSAGRQERDVPLAAEKGRERDFPLDPPEGASPPAPVKLSQNLASKMVRQQICVVLSYHCCGNLL